MSVLVLHPHPNLPPSRVDAALAAAARTVAGVTVHDLHEASPHFFVDVAGEQALVEAHHAVVLQHPVYRHAAPLPAGRPRDGAAYRRAPTRARPMAAAAGARLRPDARRAMRP